MTFDPDAAASPDSGLFGLPHGPEEAAVHVMGVPFEATTSYRGGTARGPGAVLAASHQIDLFDLMFGRPYERGIWMRPLDPEIARMGAEARSLAAPIIERGGAEAVDEDAVRRIDAAGDEVNGRVRAFAEGCLDGGVLPVILGGDHSTPYGAMVACAARHPGLGILQFDAHADLREAFEGLRWSHASVLHNVLEDAGDAVGSLVQVGIRDLGGQEHDRIQGDPRIHAVFDQDLAEARFGGQVRELARRTVDTLPDTVYVTFDVDALDPALCPHTGTPVPNGLAWDETMVWLDELSRSGRRVVGLDLNEVSVPELAGDDAWDAIVGARLLYRLIGAALRTRP